MATLALVVACVLSAQPLRAQDDAAARNDAAARKVETRLNAAGGAFDLKQSEVLPEASAASDAPAGRARPETLIAALSRPAPSGLDRIAVPAVVARAPALEAGTATGAAPLVPPEAAVAAKAAWTEAQSYAVAPRPPGGFPADRLESAARGAALALAGKTPSTRPTLSFHGNLGSEAPRDPLVAFRARKEYDPVHDVTSLVVNPTVNLAGGRARVGADFSFARRWEDAERGVLHGNPTVKAALLFGEKGKVGRTSLEVAYRPEGREFEEFRQISGETVVAARGSALLKVQGSARSSPVEEASYKVGMTLMARVF